MILNFLTEHHDKLQLGDYDQRFIINYTTYYNLFYHLGVCRDQSARTGDSLTEEVG